MAQGTADLGQVVDLRVGGVGGANQRKITAIVHKSSPLIHFAQFLIYWWFYDIVLFFYPILLRAILNWLSIIFLLIFNSSFKCVFFSDSSPNFQVLAKPSFLLLHTEFTIPYPNLLVQILLSPNGVWTKYEKMPWSSVVY